MAGTMAKNCLLHFSVRYVNIIELTTENMASSYNNIFIIILAVED